jgi:hypothetical protein
LLIGTSTVHAVTVDVPVVAVKTISAADGAAHILLQTKDLSFLNGMLIKRATLTMSLPGLVPLENLDVQVYAVTAKWDPASVTWDAPWAQAGGDWSLDHYHTVRLEAGQPAKELRLDVSSIIQTIADGDASDNGLILTTAPHENGGKFRPADMALFGASPQGALTVSYLDVPKAIATE